MPVDTPEGTRTVQAGEHHFLHGTLEEVAPPCDGDKHNGRWICLVHQETFHNQWEATAHFREGEHTAVWWCFEHDCLEQP